MTAQPSAAPALLTLDDLNLPQAPQQERSREKHAALLDAGMELFAKQGFEATTARQISERAGVSVGTFYRYFHNKRQLFLALCARNLEKLVHLGIADLDFGADPRRTIQQTVERAMDLDAQRVGIRRAWAELRMHDPQVAALDEEILAFLYKQILAAVLRARAEGLTRPDLDPEPTCWAITRLLHVSWQWEPAPQEVDPEEIRRHRNALADLIYFSVFQQTP